jgi:beta-carotene 3-hydroxylase
MTTYIFNAALVIIAFLSMEGVAWLTHKYIMHGWLWRIHADHHNKEPDAILEKNDFFFLFFSLPGIACLIAGLHDLDHYFWIGLGITLYGLAYFLVHDIFIHQRIAILKRTDSVYLRAIRKAHKVHHKHLDKQDGECFGMLWVPWRYFREASKAGGRQ